MSEFIGLGYYAEMPAVVFNVERVGPSTGLPTRTQQGDILTTAILSTATPATPCIFRARPKSVFPWPLRPSTWPSASRPRSSS